MMAGAAAAQQPPAKTRGRGASTAVTPARVLLTPRFIPGQVFRYNMQFETSSQTTHSGLVADPQGPSQLTITWDATVRVDVLPAGASAPGGIRLRTTYEKSAATIQSDTYDPAAVTIQERYQKMQGVSLEFTLDANGKPTGVTGLEALGGDEKAQQQARDWIAQITRGAGAPAAGIFIGQVWSSEQPVTTVPLAGLTSQMVSTYVRNEPCRQPLEGAAPQKSPGEKSAAPAPEVADDESCALILTRLRTLPPKPQSDPTAEDYKKRGIRAAGSWDGSGESLSHVSLRTGLVVSITQTGSETMDMTLTTPHEDSLRYSGIIRTRSQLMLAPAEKP